MSFGERDRMEKLPQRHKEPADDVTVKIYINHPLTKKIKIQAKRESVDQNFGIQKLPNKFK